MINRGGRGRKWLWPVLAYNPTIWIDELRGTEVNFKYNNRSHAEERNQTSRIKDVRHYITKLTRQRMKETKIQMNKERKMSNTKVA
jgi:hypothetical protein